MGQQPETLAPVSVTRALGLRDLKRPRPIILQEPHIEVVQLSSYGKYHIILLSDTGTLLSDEQIAQRVKDHSTQPKVASMLITQDALAQSKKLEMKDNNASSCVIGLMEVKTQTETAPPTKKQKTGMGKGTEEKIKCAHILLKHKELKVMDKQVRRDFKGATRTLAEAENEMLKMLKIIEADPNMFSKFARTASECQSSQLSGDLGWFGRGSWDAPFEDIVFNMKPGTLSDIVSTCRGVHLIHRQ